MTIRACCIGRRSHGDLLSMFAFLVAFPVALCAQGHVPSVDPMKGPPGPPPATDAAWEAIVHPPASSGTRWAAAPLPDHVVHDVESGGRRWAAASTYKAACDADGFTYVPFFGSSAPRSFPVAFRLRRVTVGGTALQLDAAAVRRVGDRLTLDRGAVQEHYDLTATQVEQTIVVATDRPGDVVVEFAVDGELLEDPSTPGLQFANEYGRVDYGEAWLVQPTGNVAIESQWCGDGIRLRVPAERRGDGPVVIDPILSTHQFLLVSTVQVAQPDIAYDAATDRYMIVWETEFSATDHDIWSELRNGDGVPVVGSLGVIDTSLMWYAQPRIANANDGDNFLVVMERAVSGQFGGRSMIFGRLRHAISLFIGSEFRISNDAYAGNNYAPDVGGCSAPIASGAGWLVAWTRVRGIGGSDIFAMPVSPTGGVGPATTIVASAQGAVYANVQVSQSNGEGQGQSPVWMLVYGHQYSPSDWDVYGSTLRPDGSTSQPHSMIDYSTTNDVFPRVSSAMMDRIGWPLFFVTYERQAPAAAAMGAVLTMSVSSLVPPTDLTQVHNLQPAWVVPESDGVRMAVISGAVGITVATLAFQGAQFVMHEAPQYLSGVPSYPRICSKRSGGSTERGAYGIVHMDVQPNPDTIVVASYSGHQQGAELTIRATGCGVVGIQVDGPPYLGNTVGFAATGASLPGLVFGLPAPATSWCPGCTLGLSATGPLEPLLAPGGYQLVIPTDAWLVGQTFAMQAFDFTANGCFGLVALGQTADFTIR